MSIHELLLDLEVLVQMIYSPCSEGTWGSFHLQRLLGSLIGLAFLLPQCQH
jgi:hypothetical protein